MNKLLCVAVLSAILLGLSQQAVSADLKSGKQKTSYAIGVNISQSLKPILKEIDIDVLVEGLTHGLKGAKLKMSDTEMKQTLMTFQQQLTKQKMAEHSSKKSANAEKGKKFLAVNKKKKGVITLKSGLQYKVIKSGKGGTSPKLTDTVTTHYRGTLIDGTEFDSSYSRKEPTTFPLKGVIKGWQEALQLMKPGDKWQLFIPSDLAYGDRGAGAKIGPGETLIFDIELIKVGS